MHGVEQAEYLHSTVAQVGPVALEGHHAPNVYIPQIHRWMTMGNPVGEDLASTTRRLNPDGVEPGRNEKVIQFRCQPKLVAVIRRETLRPVEKQLNTGLF